MKKIIDQVILMSNVFVVVLALSFLIMLFYPEITSAVAMLVITSLFLVDVVRSYNLHIMSKNIEDKYVFTFKGLEDRVDEIVSEYKIPPSNKTEVYRSLNDIRGLFFEIQLAISEMDIYSNEHDPDVENLLDKLDLAVHELRIFIHRISPEHYAEFTTLQNEIAHLNTSYHRRK